MSDKKARQATKSAEAEVQSSGWQENAAEPRWKQFPGPRGASEPLRVAIGKSAYADLTAHAKESLDAEVCGVLVGDLCEDDDGLFIEVIAIIRGTAAKKGAAHVTFTQETWNQIHQQKEKDHPKRQIVGWYHTHPGFGVEFSSMDLFIQKNFFSAPSQIAFVIDPLGGQEAIIVNASSGTKAVSRFWVDGRERTCQKPAKMETQATGDEEGSTSAESPSPSVAKALKSLEERLGQAIRAADQAQAFSHRLLLTIVMLVMVAVLYFIGHSVMGIWYYDPPKAPQVQSFVPVPVMIEGKPVMLGMAVVKWEIPKELNAAIVQVEKERQKAEEEARKKADEEAAKKGEKDKPGQPAATQPAQGGKP